MRNKKWKYILHFGENLEFKKILEKQVALSLNTGDRLFFIYSMVILESSRIRSRLQVEVEYKYADCDKKEFVVVASEV